MKIVLVWVWELSRIVAVAARSIRAAQGALLCGGGEGGEYYLPPCFQKILTTPKRILIYSPLIGPALNHGRMTTGKHHNNNGPPSYMYVATLLQMANALTAMGRLLTMALTVLVVSAGDNIKGRWERCQEVRPLASPLYLPAWWPESRMLSCM